MQNQIIMKIIKYTTIFVWILTLAACNNDFEEYNRNPYKPADVLPDVQLAGTQAAMTGEYHSNWHVNLNILMPMMQQISGEWGIYQGGRYNKDVLDYWIDYWRYAWPNEVKNVVDVVERTKDDPELVNAHSAARILKVYIFSRMTDLYGDIPYFQGGQAYYSGILVPEYDTQEEIYTDFFKELDEAVAAFDETRQSISADLFFNGDITKWRRFGNSLRLRLGMRLCKADAAKAEQEVRAAINGGLMESNDDICMLAHMNTEQGDFRGNPNSNAINSTGGNSAAFRICSTFSDSLLNNNDPRLDLYCRAYNYSEEDVTHITGYNGMGPGVWAWDNWNSWPGVDGTDTIWFDHYEWFLQPNHDVVSYDAPFFHLTYAEVELLLAEAAFRNWGATDAEQHYHNGIRANMEQSGLYPQATAINADSIAAYIEDHPLETGRELELINYELWLNHFFNGYEAYANWRRSGYPDLVPVNFDETQTGGVIPRRFFYPDEEISKNPNAQAAIDRMGGTDSWLNRVWWDKE